MNNNITPLHKEAIDVLSAMIKISSFSKEEESTAEYLASWLIAKGIEVKRTGNNVWSTNKSFDENKPTILLNSHHDTVKPNSAYTKDPFHPQIEKGKLFGLGSNDAGGCL